MNKLFQPSSTTGVRNFKLLVTCRSGISDIEDELKGFGVSLSMELGSVNADLSEYITDRAQDLTRKRNYSPALETLVNDTLRSHAGGTSLWVSFVSKALDTPRESPGGTKAQKPPCGARRKVLNGNDTGNKRKRAQFLLFSMVAARCPLQKIEIAAAIAV
jgi:hypothetical protein